MADRKSQPKKDKRKKPDEYKRTRNWGVSIKRKRVKRTRIWA